MSDKIWIIKEGSQILGPFNQAEIIAQINNKEILETDQIAAPFSRFGFLKNCEEFNLLFKISDHTEISRIEHTDATEKIDQVDPSVTGFFDITVQKPKGTSRLPYKKLPASTTIDKKRIVRKKASVAEKKKIEKKPKPVEILETSTLFKKYKSIQKPLLLLIGLISIGAYLFYSQQQFIVQQKAGTEKTNKMLFDRSTINIKLGHYENSLRDLRRILSSAPNHLQAFSHLIEVLILQKKYVEARRLLHDKSLNTVSNVKYRIYHYMALIDLQTKELSKAMQNLNNTLEQNPSFLPAIINLGTLYFLNEEYKKAAEQYSSDIITSANTPPEDYSKFEGILLLHRAANAAKSYLSLKAKEEGNEQNSGGDINDEDLDDLAVSLEEYQERTYDFKLEALIMRALLRLLLGETDISEDLLKDILELDLDLTDQHFHSPLYYYLDELLWSNTIMFIFNEIKNFAEWGKDPILLAVYGFLNFKTGNKQEGKNQINEALNLDESNQKIQTLSAYIDHKSGFVEQACRILKRHEYHLAILLQERLCTNSTSIKDIEVRKTLLDNLLLSGLFQLQIKTSFARISEIEQNRIAAKEYFQEAYDLSKNYKPLLRLQAKWLGISTQF